MQDTDPCRNDGSNSPGAGGTKHNPHGWTAFDNRIFALDAKGSPVRFITDPLAESYIDIPGRYVLPGMLPPEEFEVSAAFVELHHAIENALGVGLVIRLFQPSRARALKVVAEAKQESFLQLVNRSPAHKAAIRRMATVIGSARNAQAFAQYTR